MSILQCWFRFSVVSSFPRTDLLDRLSSRAHELLGTESGDGGRSHRLVKPEGSFSASMHLLVFLFDWGVATATCTSLETCPWQELISFDKKLVRNVARLVVSLWEDCTVISHFGPNVDP